jgi:uncharacterized protein
MMATATLNLRSRLLSRVLAASLAAIALSTSADPSLQAPPSREVDADSNDFVVALVAAAKERTHHDVTYDGRYVALEYPGGDVPSSIGVCADVVIRAYRTLGYDLQRAVHEDMAEFFDTYPRHWGLTRPDPNIDHRRVPNLRLFFSRHGQSLSPTHSADDFLPGDLVTWALQGHLPHIGIVVDGRSGDGRRPLIVHNIGRGPRMEDVLFDYPITGHYRFNPGSAADEASSPGDHPTGSRDSQ